MSTTFSFLYGPLLYFYFKRVNFNYKFKITDTLHLIPSIILLAFILPYYFMPSLEKFNVIFEQRNVLRSTGRTIIVVKIVSLTVYAFLILKMYLKNKTTVNKQIGRTIVGKEICWHYILYI